MTTERSHPLTPHSLSYPSLPLSPSLYHSSSGTNTESSHPTLFPLLFPSSLCRPISVSINHCGTALPTWNTPTSLSYPSSLLLSLSPPFPSPPPSSTLNNSSRALPARKIATPSPSFSLCCSHYFPDMCSLPLSFLLSLSLSLSTTTSCSCLSP